MKIISIFIAFFLAGCIVQNKADRSQRHLGDFRYYAGIAEFFDCNDRKKYYLAKEAAYDELIEKFQGLNLSVKEDAYLWAEGYYKEETQPYGIDPIDVFVVTKIVKFDPSRGCKQSGKVGL